MNNIIQKNYPLEEKIQNLLENKCCRKIGNLPA